MKKKETIIETFPHVQFSGTDWKSTNQKICDVVRGASTRSKRTPPNQKWLHGHLEELKILIGEKWARRTEFVRNRNNETFSRWKSSRILLQKNIRRWKRERVEALGEQIEKILNNDGEGKLKELTTELRILCKSQSKENTLCTPSNPIGNKELTNHFNNLFRAPLEQKERTDIAGDTLNLDDLDSPPTREEITEAVKQLKSGTAAGSDGLIPEIYKWGV